MNLINLFNFNYLKQNLKKSKGALAVFIGIIPIINILILFMLNDNNHSNEVITLPVLSIINFLGIFILPIVISICLFGYVFKKRSVDFVNSMPISRKSIFITNTIGGIAILVLMNLINAIFIYILSNTLSNLTIPTGMIIDYFILWTVAYVFVFTVSNIAVSISGNMITSIAVSALILFLVPFTHAFISNALPLNHDSEYIIECNNKECVPDNYYGVGTTVRNLAKENKYTMYLNRKSSSYNYTLPSNFVIGFLFNGSSYYNFYNTTSIIKTFILSLIYIVIGYFLFLKRKMEVCETSFKNIMVHNIVKCLTMVPILSFVYLMLRESYFDFVSLLILLVIIVGYYFIYDLITRKGINYLKKNIFTLLFYIPLFMLLMKGFDTYLENNKNFSVDDIKYIKIENVSKGNYNSRIFDIYFEDKEALNYLLTHTGYGTLSEDEYIKVNFRLKDNREYSYTFNVSPEDIEYMINLISKNKQVQEYINDIDYDNIYAIKLGNLKVEENYRNELIELCRKHLPNSIENVDNGLNIEMYSYTNHEVEKYSITTDNNIIKDKIMEIENKTLKEDLNNYEFQDLYFHISGYSIEREGELELYNYIKNNLDTSVDSSKDYMFIEVANYGKDKFYRYYTNDIDKINEIIDKYKIKEDTYTSEEYYYD